MVCSYSTCVQQSASKDGARHQQVSCIYSAGIRQVFIGAPLSESVKAALSQPVKSGKVLCSGFYPAGRHRRRYRLRTNLPEVSFASQKSQPQHPHGYLLHGGKRSGSNRQWLRIVKMANSHFIKPRNQQNGTVPFS